MAYSGTSLYYKDVSNYPVITKKRQEEITLEIRKTYSELFDYTFSNIVALEEIATTFNSYLNSRKRLSKIICKEVDNESSKARDEELRCYVSNFLVDINNFKSNFNYSEFKELISKLKILEVNNQEIIRISKVVENFLDDPEISQPKASAIKNTRDKIFNLRQEFVEGNLRFVYKVAKTFQDVNVSLE